MFASAGQTASKVEARDAGRVENLKIRKKVKYILHDLLWGNSRDLSGHLTL